MKRFVTKIIFFILPTILIFLPPFIILRGSGENFFNIDSLINSNNKYLIGYAYNESNYKYLKWFKIKSSESYEVIALGSSRVLQFRNKMFTKSFYNAGYTISSVKDFQPFMSSLPEDRYPKYLILGLDQWMFNRNWDNLSKKINDNSWSKSFNYYPSGGTYINIYSDLISDRYDFDVNKNQDQSETIKIGLNAIVNSKGFRNDGSMYYGTQIKKLLLDDPTSNDYQFNDTYDRIEKRNRRFQDGDDYNPEAIYILIDFLKFCKQKDITVIGFCPPFASEIYNQLISSGKYNYLIDLPKKLKQIFNQYNYEFYDYTSPIKLESNNNEFIDGFHGGEMTYLKILLDMLKKNSILLKTTNFKKLEMDLKNNKNPYMIYDDIN